jgi:transcription-repair coupling factor (superfamily II helicase)
MDKTINTLKEKIFNSVSFAHVNERFSENRQIQIFGLYGSLLSFFIVYFIERLDKTILFLTSDTGHAEQIYDDLEMLLTKGKVGFFPASETVPYDEKEPNALLVRLRAQVLGLLKKDNYKAVIAPVSALMKKVPNSNQLVEKQITIEKNTVLAYDDLLKALVAAGYKRCEIVEEVGYFSVRGSIIDIYPWNCDDPIRIEYFGDKVESIRLFNVVSQRSVSEISNFTIIANEETCDCSGTFFDYIPEDGIIILDNKSALEETIREFLKKVRLRYSEQRNQNIYPDRPDDVYIQFKDFSDFMQRHSTFRLDILKENDLPEIRFSGTAPPTFAGQLNRFFNYLKKERQERYTIFIQCESSGQKKRFLEILEEENLTESAVVSVGTVQEGFIFQEAGVHVITEHELFNRFKRKKTYPAFKSGTYLRSLHALNVNDYVVHIDYGVGRYLGLTTIESNNTKRECIKLEYADGDFLFISIDRLNRVQKFSGEEGQDAKLTKLGTGEWDRLKKKTRESIQKIADDLVALYAKRKTEQGYSYSVDSHWQKELELSFPFDETEDQLKSIQEVKQDLEAVQPMDRLLCGDVGYGKTEVALRAATKVVLDGKQVVLMVPTTILAYQHYQTFKERIAEFPINIAMLSRFLSPNKQKEVLQKLAQGQIDIVIGTHRLLSDDVKFHDLGLLVIDEEQRFGVQHKEKLKKIRTNIDVLSMTATPIPRTLHLSLMGARDLSHIETAPRNRLPVITEVHEWDDNLIQRAIERELERAGQVYLVHNRVQTIEAVGAMIRELVPKARVVVAHGQLAEKKLEKIMLDFIHKKSDVLIATMIIENGLDIPNVNTLIINHAERFGLAQLYQIRGRVGRSSQQAYAYLLIPNISRLTDLARKRLRAIQDFTELGSGLKVALRDMEIRGVGNILGKEQSGNINAVGFDLYCKILNEAVHHLKSEKALADHAYYTDPILDVDYDLRIPTAYIPDDTERLSIYHRLVNFSTIEEIERMKDECRDRFGALPSALINLFDTVELKVISKRIYASRLTMKHAMLKIHFSKSAQKDSTFFSELIPKLMSYNQNKIKFFGDKENLGVKIFLNEEKIKDQIIESRNLLHSLI